MKSCKGCIHLPDISALKAEGEEIKCKGGYNLIPSKNGRDYYRPLFCVKKRKSKVYKEMLKKRKKSRKKTYREVLVEKNDELWSKAIKIRDGFRCVKCGKTYGLQSHHFVVGRRVLNTRFLLDNGVCLCSVVS